MLAASPHPLTESGAALSRKKNEQNEFRREYVYLRMAPGATRGRSSSIATWATVDPSFVRERSRPGQGLNPTWDVAQRALGTGPSHLDESPSRPWARLRSALGDRPSEPWRGPIRRRAIAQSTLGMDPSRFGRCTKSVIPRVDRDIKRSRDHLGRLPKMGCTLAQTGSMAWALGIPWLSPIERRSAKTLCAFTKPGTCLRKAEIVDDRPWLRP
jgi:hypothetical protein